MEAVQTDRAALQTLLQWQKQYIGLLEQDHGVSKSSKKYENVKHAINVWSRKIFLSNLDEKDDGFQVYEEEKKNHEEAAHTKTLLRESKSKERELNSAVNEIKGRLNAALGKVQALESDKDHLFKLFQEAKNNEAYHKEKAAEFENRLNTVLASSKSGNTVLVSELDQVRSECEERIKIERKNLMECRKDNSALREELVNLIDQMDCINQNSQKFVTSLDSAINFYNTASISAETLGKNKNMQQLNSLLEQSQFLKDSNESMITKITASQVAWQSELESLTSSQEILEKQLRLDIKCLRREVLEKSRQAQRMEEKYNNLVRTSSSEAEDQAFRNEEYIATLRKLLEETKAAFQSYRESTEIQYKKLREEALHLRSNQKHESYLSKQQEENLQKIIKKKDEKISDLAQRVISAEDQAKYYSEKLFEERLLTDKLSTLSAREKEKKGELLESLRLLSKTVSARQSNLTKASEEKVNIIQNQISTLADLIRDNNAEKEDLRKERNTLLSAKAAITTLYNEQKEQSDLSKATMKALEMSANLQIKQLKAEAIYREEQASAQIERARASTVIIDHLSSRIIKESKEMKS